MRNIVLDTNVIIEYPKLLGLNIPDIHFLVPLEVVAQLNIGASKEDEYSSIIEVIDKGVEQSTISIINTNLPGFERYFQVAYLMQLERVDAAIIACALAYQERGEETQIATFDKVIRRTASEVNIDIVSKSEIESFITNFKKPTAVVSLFQKIVEVLIYFLENLNPISSIFDFNILRRLLRRSGKKTPSLEGKILSYERWQKVKLYVGVLIGVVFTMIGFFIYKNLDIIIGAINVWGTIIMVLLIGIILFIIRERQRLAYGIFEFLVGGLAIVLIFKDEGFDYSHIKFTMDFNIKLLGGLYIMVRGQDNIVKALRNTKIGIKLQKLGIGN